MGWATTLVNQSDVEEAEREGSVAGGGGRWRREWVECQGVGGGESLRDGVGNHRTYSTLPFKQGRRVFWGSFTWKSYNTILNYIFLFTGI